MMELARHEGWHLELCRHNRAVLETPAVRDDPEKRHAALSRAVLYLVLAPHEPEQADLTHRLLTDKLLDEIPTYKYYLFSFDKNICQSVFIYLFYLLENYCVFS